MSLIRPRIIPVVLIDGSGQAIKTINFKRQNMVDSWPADVDDSAARSHWNWSPEFDLDSAFENYLIPQITKRYEK